MRPLFRLAFLSLFSFSSASVAQHAHSVLVPSLYHTDLSTSPKVTEKGWSLAHLSLWGSSPLVSLSVPEFHGLAFGPTFMVVVSTGGIRLIEGKRGTSVETWMEWIHGSNVSVACTSNAVFLSDGEGALFELDVESKKMKKVDVGGQVVWKVAAGKDNVAVITANGQVWTMGNNEFGQCGQNKSERFCEFGPVFTSTKLLTVQDFPCPSSKQHWKSDSTQKYHPSLPEQFFTRASSLSPFPAEELITTPLPPASHDPVIDVAVGSEHMIFVTKTGNAFSCGNDIQLQLAQGEPWRTGYVYRTIPSKINFLDGINVLKAAAGDAHSAVIVGVENRTDVITWGNGSYGQLGLANLVHVGFPRMVESLHARQVFNENKNKLVPLNVLQLASGDNHLLALLSDGSVMAWGGNNQGQCIPTSRANVITPFLVTFGKDANNKFAAQRLFAGYNKSGALL